MDRDRLLNTFLELVRIDSPSGSEENVASYLRKIFINLGLEPLKDSYGNLVVKIKGFGEPLLLSAHMDTVEPGRNIRPQIIDGIIKSSGDTILGADNKVAIAAIIEIVRDIVENKIKSRPLNIIFTKGEEIADAGAFHIDPSMIEAKKGYVFDNENPIGTIILSSPFYYGLNIKIKGKGAHASMPEKGINALKIFNKALNRIKLGKINSKTIANIGIVRVGHVANSIPAEASLVGEVRSFIEKQAIGYINFIIEKFREEAVKIGGRIESSFSLENPGYIHKKNDELVIMAQKAFKNLNIKSVLKESWGCSDANILNKKGIKTVNLSEGIMGTHTVNESVSIKNLNLLSKLIFSLVTSLH